MSHSYVKQYRQSSKFKVSRLALAVSLASTLPIVAQAEDNSRFALEEIVVTAKKREQNLQDVSAVVNIVGGEQMKDLGIFDFQQVASITAGLSLDRVSGNEQAITLRGVKMPAFAAAGTTSTVDYYFNEIPQKVTDAYSSLYDVRQLEVVRGPQGTLRGRLSPSGAIILKTNRPNFESVDATVSVGLSDNGLRNVQAAGNVGLTDNFALRLAAVYDESDDNAIKSIPTGDKSGHENKSYRLTALWEPLEDLSVTFIGQSTREDAIFNRAIYGTGTAAAGNLNGVSLKLEDDTVYNSGPNVSEVETDIITAQVEYVFAGHKFTSLTGYQESKFFDIIDLDFTGNGLNMAGTAPVWGPFQSVDRTWDDEGLTQEFRLESIDRSTWNYTIGYYYEEVDREFTDVRPLTPARNTYSSQVYTNNTTTDWAVFTNHILNLTESLTLEAGVRYSEREVEREDGSTVDFDTVTGNGSLSYHIMEEMMVYGSVGTSWRPGGGGTAVSGSTVVPDSLLDWEDEESTSYELGLKGSMLEGRIDYSAAFFLQEYDSFANSTFNIACTGVPTTDGSLSFATLDGTVTGGRCTEDITYGGDAFSKGFELEMRAMLTESWYLQMNASYAKAEYDGATIPCNDYDGDGTTNATGTPRVQAGKYYSTCTSDEPLGDVPKWGATANSEYTFSEVVGVEPYVRVLFDYRDERYFPQTGDTLRSLKRWDLFTGVRSSNGWDAQVFVKNLLDDRVQDNEGGEWNVGGQYSGFNVGSLSRGREIGARFTYNFDG